MDIPDSLLIFAIGVEARGSGGQIDTQAMIMSLLLGLVATISAIHNYVKGIYFATIIAVTLATFFFLGTSLHCTKWKRKAGGEGE